MIFVTVGTTDFDELIRTMDHMASRLDEKVVAQIGNGSYRPDHLDYFRFAPALDLYFAGARVVISHGGLGTLIEALENGSKLIGISNPDRYNLHQEDLLYELDRQGCLLWCRKLSDLENAIQEIGGRTFKPYEKPDCSISDSIKDFLNRPRSSRSFFIRRPNEPS